MPRLLAIDVGSSSVKAAILENTDLASRVGHAPFPTNHRDGRAEVDPEQIVAAVRAALRQVSPDGPPDVPAVGLTAMAPAWVAFDADARPLTPVVTHQDRRATDDALRIEAAVGRQRHLAIAGNRPAPGGISSTVASWFARNTDVLRHARTVGHLPTLLLARWTATPTPARVIDPSNAAFTGLFDVNTGDWSAELCAAAGVDPDLLPDIVDAATVVGRISPDAARDFGLPEGADLFGGYVDGSGALLLAGPRPGKLVHSAGTTDVLALCLDRPAPRDGLLCRPLGTGDLWVAAATQPAGGASIDWVRERFFHDVGDREWHDLVDDVAADPPDTRVRFRPALGGDRTRVRQPAAVLTGLTLDTTGRDVLAAVVRGLARDTRDRMTRLLALAAELNVAVDSAVTLTGGGDALARRLHASWPAHPDGRRWSFHPQDQATLRGLGTLVYTAA